MRARQNSVRSRSVARAWGSSRLCSIVPIILSGLLFALCPQAHAYSVFTHESIVDRTWCDSIVPALLKRFPSAGAGELEEARGYAYGGALIQDLGYFPGSDPFFSDLTHYVRSGDFVEAMARDSRSLDEYAFAIGALEHYVADNIGHPMATNPAVALYHPGLRSRYGSEVTYEDSPRAHTEAEIGFDIVEVVAGWYGLDASGRVDNLTVAEPLLARAFKETYGLDLGDLLKLDIAVASYRYSVSRLLPRLAAIAWDLKTREVLAQSGSGRAEPMPAQFDGQGIIAAKENAQHNRTFLGSVAGRLVSVPYGLPLVSRLNFEIPTHETENLFIASYNLAIDQCCKLVAQVGSGSLHLENTNLDTGMMTRRGDYRKADQAYARLVAMLARRGLDKVTPELRDAVLSFYDTSEVLTPRRNKKTESQSTIRAVERLRNQSRLREAAH